jgi:hypothetical protein
MLPGKYIKVSLWETRNLVDELDQDNGLIILINQLIGSVSLLKLNVFIIKTMVLLHYPLG